ncbi:DNA mismatch repair protein MutT [Clostridium novyi A str. 4570]|uniref:NAD(+) diphosphatase n=1 Tax=Clostridium novyi A str. 4570 TaxID=1444290 RepID=A0AA88ZMS7_CLONO|nr:NUDIX domain-containing protein [Clostridium novyi]KGM99633.1 DNA mismatch repair protein MutT [Clostridium novyi A str. 4570]
MIYKFCPICGNKLELRDSWDEGYVPYCPVDDKMFFDLPKPCIVVAVLKEDKVLLMKQSYIYRDSKVLISGYVDIGEEVEDTVIREVKEETGITVNNVRYLGSDFVEPAELLMLTFRADYLDGEILKSDEVEWVNWVHIKDALPQMTEDKIGKRVIRKILDEDGYN